METNIYTNNPDLTNNLGDTLVHWIKKVREIKADKANGTVRNEQSPDGYTGRISVKMRSS